MEDFEGAALGKSLEDSGTFSNAHLKLLQVETSRLEHLLAHDPGLQAYRPLKTHPKGGAEELSKAGCKNQAAGRGVATSSRP